MNTSLGRIAITVAMAALHWKAFLLGAAEPAQPARLRLDSPVDYQVFQRQSPSHGLVQLSGRAPAGSDLLEVQIHGHWVPVDFKPEDGVFHAQVSVPAGGWYVCQVRALAGRELLALTEVPHVGIGEVFVVAGQSNSANHGEEKQQTKTERVAAWDGNRWQLANDPQPGASGSGGSFMPPFGDAIAEQFDVPVGIVACGIGATSVREWLPKGDTFPQPPTLIGRVQQLPDGRWESKGEAFAMLTTRMKQLGPRGFRAVLWHQGESDANQKDPTRTLPGDLYRQYLERLIRESSRELGWEPPWFVAQATYHVPGDEASPDIRAAQKLLWDLGVALEGPDTDALKGPLREAQGQGVHFSGPGLREHAARWVAKIAPWLKTQLASNWQQYLKPNPAYLRAQQRPTFSMKHPVGLVTSETEKQQQRQAAEQLRNALTAARERGDNRFAIPPGQYRFADNRGFVLSQAKDFTLMAKDVTFWFERQASQLAADPKGLELNQCRNVTLRGLKIDFDPPVFLQARILEIDEDQGAFVVEIDPDFPDAEMPGGSYFLYRADGRWIPHGYLFYRECKRIKGRKHRVLLDDARVFEVHNRNEANLRLTGGTCRIGPGDYIVLPWRRSKGISMHRCGSCLLEDVDLYASPGMGVLEYQGPGGNVYRRLRIMPPPGTRRLHACAADGFHNAQTDRGPQLIECEFTGTSDDFLNLHGHFGVVWRKLDERRYIIGQANLSEIKPGETLTFYDDETVDSLGAAEVQSLQPLEDQQLIGQCNAITLPRHANRNYYTVVLDRDIALAEGDLVALNRFRSAGFLIKDCYFHDAMARTLINGAGDGAILGNIIERAAWGLVVHFETWQYFEGPMPRNVRISGNVFREIRDLLLPQHATALSVTMVPTHGGYLRPSHPLRNIKITENYIERPGGFAIVLTNTDGAEIARNTMVEPMYRPAMTGGDLRAIQFHLGHPNYFEGKARPAAIGLWSCRDIEVRANRLIDPQGYCQHGLLQIGEPCENIRVLD